MTRPRPYGERAVQLDDECRPAYAGYEGYGGGWGGGGFFCGHGLLAEELALVASHLTHRARAAGVNADPERVRRVAVQLLPRAPVDANLEPRHAPLAVAWLQRALRATPPFSPGVATRDPGPLARSTAAVDPTTLAFAPPSSPGQVG